MNDEARVKQLCSISEKQYVGLICEEWTRHFQYFVNRFNQDPKERWQIGCIFYSYLRDKPKEKLMYMSFLERQEDTNPKCYKNVMRFLREMQIKTEFQTR